MKAIRAPVIAALFFVAACASPAMDPDLSLHDRFVLTALTEDDGSPAPRLLRWQTAIRLHYDGPEEYRHAVYEQANQLGAVAEQPVRTTPHSAANFFVEISNRDTPNRCQVRLFGSTSRYTAEVHIWIKIPDWEIRQCIAQEMTQAMGPVGDLDGFFGSRQDTVFASYGGAPELTAADLQVLQILYDFRLRSGMPRDQVLAVLPEIVADVEAQQGADR